MGDNPSKDPESDEKLDADIDEVDRSETTKKSRPNASGNDNSIDSSDDEQANNDDADDATGIKLKSRKVDETEYDDPEEAEKELDGTYTILLPINTLKTSEKILEKV